MVRVRIPARAQKYEIKVAAGLLGKLGGEVRAALGTQAQTVAFISNQTVFDLYGEVATKSLRSHGFGVKHLLIPDGERHKSFASFELVIEFLAHSRSQRNDVIVSLGGGVIGDIAGFAAATFLRGINFVQVPTTLLSQIDSSVGGKTGINLSAGKNLVGAFHQPRLVVIDPDTLQTLPRRELTSGFCEMIKQGAIGSRQLFDQTKNFLDAKHARGSMRTELAALIAAHCRFKASIVAGDEREDLSRTDRSSRRILNFGHTTAHALEKITAFRRFRHGEAVGYGMLVAGEISKSLGMLPSHELELLREAVRACGQLPRANDLAADEVMRATRGDKKSIAGKINWVLLERIGRARIVSADQIDRRTLLAGIRSGLRF